MKYAFENRIQEHHCINRVDWTEVTTEAIALLDTENSAHSTKRLSFELNRFCHLVLRTARAIGLTRSSLPNRSI